MEQFTLEGLDKLIESAKEKKEDPKPSFEDFTPIVRGVAAKYTSQWIDFDDLEQELWVVVLDLIQDCGGIENVDKSLVARCCYNRAVDIYRYNRRRYDSKAQYIEGTDIDDDDLRPDYFEALKSDKYIRGYDLILIKEVINQFAVGSRKRQYVVMKLVNNGVLSKEQLDDCDKEFAKILYDDENETGYIHSLGYKSHCPGSFTCLKRELKKEIHDFLGVDLP